MIVLDKHTLTYRTTHNYTNNTHANTHRHTPITKFCLPPGPLPPFEPPPFKTTHPLGPPPPFGVASHPSGPPPTLRGPHTATLPHSGANTLRGPPLPPVTSQTAKNNFFSLITHFDIRKSQEQFHNNFHASTKKTVCNRQRSPFVSP